MYTSFRAGHLGWAYLNEQHPKSQYYECMEDWQKEIFEGGTYRISLRVITINSKSELTHFQTNVLEMYSHA